LSKVEGIGDIGCIIVCCIKFYCGWGIGRGYPCWG
jgi:hypothetical protein